MSEHHDQRGERREYDAHSLSRAQIDEDPIAQFGHWLRDAKDAEIKDATAMALATADAAGMPAVRIVLLKHFDAEGFCWYTDRESHKGEELAANPQASLLFYWRDFDRQVRISGKVERLDETHSDQYFHERPAGSRFSAAASQQSQAVDSRATLEARVAALQAQYPNDEVPRPERWGGYRLIPASFEFWQGRESRLHDRFRFVRTGDNWLIERLQP